MTAIYKFYNLIDIIKIAKQFSGKGLTEVLTLPKVAFKFQERATIARMLFIPFKNKKA